MSPPEKFPYSVEGLPRSVRFTLFEAFCPPHPPMPMMSPPALPSHTVFSEKFREDTNVWFTKHVTLSSTSSCASKSVVFICNEKLLIPVRLLLCDKPKRSAYGTSLNCRSKVTFVIFIAVSEPARRTSHTRLFPGVVQLNSVVVFEMFLPQLSPLLHDALKSGRSAPMTPR